MCVCVWVSVSVWEGVNVCCCWVCVGECGWVCGWVWVCVGRWRREEVEKRKEKKGGGVKTTRMRRVDPKWVDLFLLTNQLIWSRLDPIESFCCVCVCVYVCVCMYVFSLFVKRSTYICQPLHKYKIDTCVSTSFSAHLDTCIVKMAGGQVDSVESTWVKSMLQVSTRRQAPATVIPISTTCRVTITHS